MVPMPAMVPGAKVMPLVENCGVLSGGGKGGDAKLVRYVALLRGINVGGRRVKMDRLREIFIGMGFTRVSTFIASGNVIFSTGDDPATLGARIGERLEQVLGWDVTTFIRTPHALTQIAAHRPADHTEDRALYIIFIHSPASVDLRERFAALDAPSDRFTLSDSGCEIFWSIATKISESPLFGGKFEKAIKGVANSTRNTTSLAKLVAKLGSD
jgi:uncharacterized protein (DUF1697 family)